MRSRLTHAAFWAAALVVIYAAAVSYMLKPRKENEGAL